MDFDAHGRQISRGHVTGGLGGFDGWLGGLMVFMSGQNLTDEPYVQFTNNDPRQITRYSSYGSTYQLGVRYRF